MRLPDAFTPKLITVLAEGYGPADLRRDALAGLTVAVVAAPLSMAIAVASGATPAQGLATAVVGGLIVSALGGSRHQIGGPAGAFILLVALTVERHGMDGLFLAAMLSGLMLAAAGALRLGAYVKYVPYPVAVGFTAGIAVLILASQLAPLTGLRPAAEPGPLADKLPALWSARATLNPAALGLSAGVIALILAIRRWRPAWPGMLIAVILAAAAVAAFGLPVDTIGSRFGGIPRGLPAPAPPPITLAKLIAVFPDALAFTLLGAIESLLSAVVADGMTGRRHRSNMELIAQGAANLVTPLFGGIVVTGTIARTATNVRAGARGPLAGIFHALFILAFMWVAAPLAAHIPLAALAGVLAVVAVTMVEWSAIRAFARARGGDAAVLALVFALTVFRDLTEAIVAGVALGSILFLHRSAQAQARDSAHLSTSREGPRPDDEAENPIDRRAAQAAGAAVWRASGAFAFGSVAAVGAALERIADTRRILVLDLSAAPFVDSTAANLIEGLARRARARGGQLWICGASAEVRRELFHHHARPPLVAYAATVQDALAAPPP